MGCLIHDWEILATHDTGAEVLEDMVCMKCEKVVNNGAATRNWEETMHRMDRKQRALAIWKKYISKESGL